MKQLIFIDNDHLERAEEDLIYVRRALKNYIDRENTDIEVSSNFRNLDRIKQVEKLFSKDNIVVTRSMFTATHMNSLGQLEHFLSMAGRNDISGKAYIDTSGYLIDTLNKLCRDSEESFNILCAIERNIIITTDMDGDYKALYRMRVELKGRWEKNFRLDKLTKEEFKTYLNDE